MNYILGKESEDEFISRHDYSYPAMKYINKFTPKNARIRLIFLAGRGYYLERTYKDDSSMGMDFIRGLVAASNDDKTFPSYINSLGYTHLLVRTDLYLKFLHDNYTMETTNRLLQQMNGATEMIYNANDYAVFRLIPSR